MKFTLTDLADFSSGFIGAHRELSGLPSAVFTIMLGAEFTLFGILA